MVLSLLPYPIPIWETQGQLPVHPSGSRLGNRQTGRVRERTGGIWTQYEVKSQTQGTSGLWQG